MSSRGGRAGRCCGLRRCGGIPPEKRMRAKRRGKALGQLCQAALGPRVPAHGPCVPSPALGLAPWGVGEPELLGLVSHWEESVVDYSEACSWVTPGPRAACPTFLSQKGSCHQKKFFGAGILCLMVSKRTLVQVKKRNSVGCQIYKNS